MRMIHFLPLTIISDMKKILISRLVVWRFCCLDGLQEDFNLWWQCLSESFPSLPVYFGSGGGLEDLRISGFFAHVIDKRYICVY